MRANEKNLYGCVLVALAVVAIFGQSASADTSVGGIITVDTHWTATDGPYIATQSILVTSGATLSIDPGVEVRFDPQTALTVTSGQLIARGTEAEPICFTANTIEDRWGHIGFGDQAVDATYDGSGVYLSGSIIEHAIIEYGGSVGLGTLNIDSSSPYISSVSIKHNLTSGIYGRYAHGLKIVNSAIQHNQAYYDTPSGAYGHHGGGINLRDSNCILISNNTVSDNTSTCGGICIRDSDHATVQANDISNNTVAGSCGGLRIWDSDNAQVLNNDITGNTADYDGAGLYLSRSDGAYISGNLIEDNTGLRVGDQGGHGGGIFIYESNGTSLSNNTVSGNSTAGNGAGVYLYYSSLDMTMMGDHIINNRGDGIYIVDAHYSSFGVEAPVLSFDPDNPTWIFANDEYNVFNAASFTNLFDPEDKGNVDARYVWWGMIDEAEIQAGIYDFFDDAGRGIVFYDPWAVPEPATLLLLAFGGLAVIRWRRR